MTRFFTSSFIKYLFQDFYIHVTYKTVLYLQGLDQYCDGIFMDIEI